MADEWDAFPAAPSAAPAPSPGKSEWDAFPAAPSYGAIESGLEGYLKGASANWRDEIYGASKASGLPDWMGGFRAPVGAARLAYENYTQPGKNLSSLVTGDSRGPVQKEYERARDEKRRQEEEMQKQNPLSFGAGELTGAAADMILPGMAGVRAAAPAATVAGRIGQSAAAGAGYGALAGAGEGEGTAGAATGAVTGGLTGAGLGAAGAGLVEAAQPIVGPLVNRAVRTYRGWQNPEEQAIRDIGAAFRRDRDVDAGRPGDFLTPAEVQLAQQRGIPLGTVDLGGENVRGLARTVSNLSPDALNDLGGLARNRFQEQSPRMAGFIREITGGADAAADTDAIQAVAARVNRPAYRAAYRAGENGIWTPELERLAGAPAVRQAMQNAVERGRNRAVGEGFGAFNPGVTFENGVMQFGRGRGAPPYPNMQFWDYTQRELRDMQTVAQRAGRNEEAGAIGTLRRSLLSELDAANPAFQQARQGAAQFFGAENALEAGRNFVRSSADIPQARRAVAAMSPAERELFARGYASDLSAAVERSGDNRNIVISNLFNNPAARQRNALALGPGRAQQLEAMLRVEGLLDRLRPTVTGNSTTARQLAAMTAFGLGDAAVEGRLDPIHMGAAALAGALLHRGTNEANQRIAAQIGRLLASDRPIDLARAARIAARNGEIMSHLRQITGGVVTGAGTEAITGNQPNKGFKHGGVASQSGGKAQPVWWLEAKATRGGRTLTQQDHAALKWVSTHPRDPRADQIKQRLGVQ